MSRLHTLFAIVLPSMLAGGVLFGSAFGRADAGRSLGLWPSSDATVVAQADPRPPRRPIPPIPPAPPAFPGSGMSISIHDGKVDIDGIRGMIDRQIADALDMVNNAKGVPPDVRAKLATKLEKVRAKLARRFSHLDINDLDQLGDEMGKLGDEIGKEMDEFGREMEKYGDQLGKDFEHKFGKGFGVHVGQGGRHASHDDDGDDDDDDKLSSADVDDQDLDDAAADLGDLSLAPGQRQEIRRLRDDSDREIATAKRALDQAAANLKHQLDNPGSSDLEIERAVDAVTQQEARIRKARLLAWHGARRVLDQAQRQKVEDAAAKAHHK